MAKHEKCVGHSGIAREVLPGRLYAGAGMSKSIPPAGAVIIDLADQFVPVVRSIGLQIPGLTVKYLGIKWPDGGVPQLSKEQWQAIAGATRRGKVFVGCMGGHGRTGTALIMLLHFWKAFPTKDTDPVAWVREHYCPEAVETSAQIKYVETITGRTTTCAPSMNGRAATVTHEPWSKGPGLCPEKVGHSFCNRDKGHHGEHDGRARAILFAEGLAGGAKWTQSKGQAPERIVYCSKSIKCLRRDKHEGPCNDSLAGGK